MDLSVDQTVDMLARKVGKVLTMRQWYNKQWYNIGMIRTKINYLLRQECSCGKIC